MWRRAEWHSIHGRFVINGRKRRTRHLSPLKTHRAMSKVLTKWWPWIREREIDHPYEIIQSTRRLRLKAVPEPNLWKYNFDEVSGHNLESYNLPKQTKTTKHTETNQNFLQKITKYVCSLSNCLGCSSVCSVQLKHRNSLFQYRSETIETNILFRIVLKLVSVVSNRN